MRKYKDIFYSFHALYRLTSTLSDIQNFILGVSRLYQHIFSPEKLVIICKLSTHNGFLKVAIDKKKKISKKGKSSILSRREKEILKHNREVMLGNRMIYPFVYAETFGAVYVKRKKEPFTEIEKKWFIALSEQISVYLKIYRLYEEQHRMIINYLRTLTSFLDKYMPHSYIHTKSVSKLIKAVGKEMKLTVSEIRSLEYASMLHDTGKLEIPPKLLRKSQHLTADEYRLMMEHPRKGAKFIRDLNVLKPVIPIILHHHERYDGKGYPSRLKKEGIPLGSRVLAVIDAFDAMFFGRPYKQRKEWDEVIKELKKESGKQFDPKIVEVFLKVLKRRSLKNYLNSFR